MNSKNALKGSIISAVVMTAVFAFSGVAFAATTPAAAPTPCDNQASATPFMSFTQSITEPDSGHVADWANDAFTENVTAWLGTDGTTFCAQGLTTDGTFETTGPSSPEAGAPLAAGITGTITGGETWVLPAGTATTTSDTNPTITADNSATDGQYNNWQSQVFTQTAGASTYAFTYVTASNGTWTNASTGDSGDITGLKSVDYVDATNGSDSNAGTQAHPYATIQAGINGVSAGGTVNVAAGTYNETLTTTSGVTLQGAGASNTTISGELTIVGDGTTVKGFKFTNPNSDVGMLIKANNTDIENNTFDSVGTTPASGSAQAILVEYGSGNLSNITISNNVISNIGNASLVKNTSTGASSAKGIFIGDTNFTHTISNVTISNNTISNIIDSSNTFANLGRGAYGILVNYGNGAAGVSTTGLSITGNTISGLSGNWAHAIGLEANTPNAVVTGNTISNLTSSTGDAAAVHVEANSDSASITLNNNSFDTTTLAFGVTSSVATNIDASKNFWNNGNVDPSSKTATSSTGTINVTPWYADAAMTTLTNGVTITTASNATTTTPSSNGVTTTVAIPAGTEISGTNWDGTLETPTVVASQGITPSSNSTVTSTIISVEMGSTQSELMLSKAARITFSGLAGKLVGWSFGGTFHAITAACTADTQAAGDALADGADCKMDVNGDLVVWTKHFTVFSVYTETADTGTTSGGGGGGGGNGPIITSTTPVTGATTGTTGGTTGTVGGTTGGGQVLGASTYNFATDLTIGSTGADVTALQQALLAAGFSIPAITNGTASYGYFGEQTREAVAAYQVAHGITPTAGYFGPITRASFNAGTTPTMTDEQRSILIASLTAQLQSLEAQLAAILAAKAAGTSN